MLNDVEYNEPKFVSLSSIDEKLLPVTQGLDSEEYNLKREVTRALKILKPKHQKVIELVTISGMNYDFVGNILGVTENRIRQIERNALKKLKIYGGLNEFDPFKDVKKAGVINFQDSNYF